MAGVSPRSRDVLVSARGLGVRRQGRWLVNGVDIEIARGEILTLIGPNGGGKTTTAKAMLGLIRPDAGVVNRRPDLKIGYVPQRFAVEWTLPLTVARLMTLSRFYSPREISGALERAGAAHLAEAAVQNLSGGEFQRVLLARAIIGSPDFLVLDEPVQGVDYAGEIALYELIGRVRDELGCGVLLISHDLHIVMAGTDTVVCLNGHICCSGAPGQVVADTEYKRMFGARGASALAIYQHEHDHSHDPHDGIVTDVETGCSHTEPDHGHGGRHAG
ncbi:MAG TPA: ATP-binding cassette domain-containing protein [Hyphomicrobiaceae bacterium]|nr:ATP-binding cassette domain-containing protein [Hyphomicrobiaceae bacterium]